MRLAVVIPTLDRPDALREALASVALQTRLPDEVHVVVDGGPRQPALETEYGERLPLRWHLLPQNVGQAAARNFALARTEAGAVAFLDDDDLFLEPHLERLERSLRQGPSLALVYDDAEIWLTDGSGATPAAARRRRIEREYDAGLMRRWDYVPPCSWLARTDALQRAGGFDATLRCYEDWDLLLRLEAWGGARRVPGPGSVVRIRRAPVEETARAAGPNANQSLRFDAWRGEMLARFQAKHDLRGIEPMTFWEVAQAVAVVAP